jgi:hypothetical protein
VIPSHSKEKMSPPSEVGIVYEHERNEGESARPLDISQLIVSVDTANVQRAVQPYFPNGHQAVILLDQSTNSSYVSTAFAERSGIRQRPLKTPVTVAIATWCSPPVIPQLMCTDARVVGTNLKSNLLAFPLGTCDVILCTPWYIVVEPKGDWRQWACNGCPAYSQGGRSVGHPRGRARQLLSTMVNAEHQKRLDNILVSIRIYSSQHCTRRKSMVETHLFPLV